MTARGSGTGLSGACIPSADGIVCALDRMQRIVEIDLDNHCAVVEAGVTLDQLDEATAPHGLVYPVYPGETSASLGGNVATNAGGMRAVKYGVTRHQVLGLEAVLATGEVIRTGGKFVKATTGYDLTQLIIGSEGTLAIVTEAILKLYPRPAHNATVLAPFSTLDEVSAAVPRIVNSGVNPLILEYIDALSMAATTANVGLDLGIPQDVQGRDRRRTSWSSSSSTTRDRLDDDTAAVAELLGELGALDVYVLPPHSAALLLEAREKAFWVAKQNGANDIIDVVVPRASVPEYLATVRGIAEEHADLGRGRRARRRRQRAPVGVPGRRGRAAQGDAGDPRGRDEARRRDLGRARHRQGEEALLPRARGSGQDRADAAHQGRVRPARHPQPGHPARLTLRPD